MDIPDRVSDVWAYATTLARTSVIATSWRIGRV
jgi:hypothetical protein